MLHLTRRGTALTMKVKERSSVSLIEGGLQKAMASPCKQDRFFSANGKSTPNGSFLTRNKSPLLGGKEGCHPFLTGLKRSPVLCTPKRLIQFCVKDQVLDAPYITDSVPNQIISVNEHDELAVSLCNSVYIYRNGEVENFLAAEQPIDSLEWHGKNIVVSIQGEVEIWDTVNKKQLSTLPKHTGKCNCIATTDKRIATGGSDNLIQVTDLRTMSKDVFSGHTSEVVALAWSPDCTILASADIEGKVILWGNNRRKRITLPLPVNSISWLTQTVLLLGASDEEGSVISMNVLYSDGESKVVAKSGNPLSKIIKHPRYGFLMAHRKQVFDWDIYGKDFIKIASFHGHSADILNICSTKEGNRVITISADETLRIWDITEKSQAVKSSSNERFVLR